ncbi:MAG TPA: toast rack family protein [Thermomicrobiaceae bacterium]|nr:toast rack family protein [Thermomicrobiaceae bacterium]
MAHARRHWWLAMVIGVLLLAPACAGYGSITSTSRSVEQAEAQTVWAEFRMHTGSLNLSGGAARLMDARFTANQQLLPNVDYDTKNGQGWLHVKQPDVHHAVNFSKMRNAWDVRLSNSVPLDINTSNDSGDTALDLTGLQVTHAGITSESGDVVLTVGGEQPFLSALNVDSSSGRVRLDLGGSFAHLTSLKVDSLAGDVTLDLSGQWSDHLNGEIHASSGTVTVRVPKSTAAVIHAGVTSGKVKADGFKSDNGSYTTAANAKSATVITLDVTVNAGQIVLEQVG